jgi:putative flippase GtrA
MTGAARLRVQLARFLLVGVLNTILGLSVILAAKALLGWGDFAANAIGYAVGLVASFVLNRSWTFRDRGRISPAFVRFVAAFALAYLANLATVFGLRDLASVNSYFAQVAGIFPYTAIFFVASRAFVFLDRRPGTPLPSADRPAQ